MPKSRLSAIISLLLVFLSGVLVGAVSHRLYTFSSNASSPPPGAQPPREDPEIVRQRILADMRQRLSLDDGQIAKLNAIYDDTRRKFDELHKQANKQTRDLWDDQTNQIRDLLRPDQLPKYEQLRKERDEERKKRKRPMDQKGPPPAGPRDR